MVAWPTALETARPANFEGVEDAMAAFAGFLTVKARARKSVPKQTAMPTIAG
jgi:hypothetical protein